MLFAVYMDDLIVKLQSSGYGCTIAGVYLGCFLYADDIILVSHSVMAMQSMLDICTIEGIELDIKYNVAKSCALRIGPRFKAICASLQLSGRCLMYVDRIKYLGIVIVSGKAFVCSYDHLKLKFYRCFNALYSKAKSADSELVTVQLLQSYCLPVITYALEATWPKKSVTASLDRLYDRAVNKIFKVTSRENIKLIRDMLGLIPMEELVDLRKIKFLSRFQASGLRFAGLIVQLLR